MNADEILAMINRLREPEGSCVSIPCDNPDFNGLPDCMIYVRSDWTDWEEQRFTGDSLAAALAAAEAARAEKENRDGATSESTIAEIECREASA